ncbi:rod shape-determining protein MreC [Acidobacteria bacterium AB60]|nr:rod shape-determining protein MreC [Acidobacteria bacterium AB60]
MESFFVRYRNLLVLLVLLLAQIIGLAMQVRRTVAGRMVFSGDASDGSGVRLIRLWANWVVSPPERALQSSKTGVGSIWSNYFDLLHVRQENKDLQATVDRLRLEQAALLEDARQGQRLQALQGFQQKYLYTTVIAQVIGTSGSDQSRVFYIDKGRDDGLARDMAVITPDGIVGKVREVFPHTAQVLGINDQSSGAGVILESTRIRGILRGNAFGQPQVVNILADQRIKPGERVLTAGGDQIFPRGLSVGTVQKVVNDPDRDGFIEVVIKPDAHLDSLDEVMVITSTQPRFSDAQMKDLAVSQDLKGAEAAALADQQRASQVMAERLPGLTDPNATPPAANGAPAGSNGAPAPNGATASGGVTVVPKILPPQHADRFTPGGAQASVPGAGTQKSAPAPGSNSPNSPSSGTPPSEKSPAPKKTAQPGAGSNAAPKAASKPEAEPHSAQPQEKP